MAYPEFQEEFQRMMRAAEANAAAKRAPKAAPKAFDAAKKAAKRNDASGKASKVHGGNDSSSGDDAPVPASSRTTEGGDGGGGKSKDGGPGAFDMSKISKLKGKKGGGGSSSKDLSAKAGGEDAKSPEKPEKPKKAKEKRVWADTKGKAADLDFSEGQPADGEEVIERVDITKPSRIDAPDDSDSDNDEDEGEKEMELSAVGNEAASSRRGKKKSSWLSGMLSNSLVRGVVGKSSLEREDIEPILEKLKTNFMNKNVAEAIAERLCESVAASLQGRKLASFSSLSGMVKSAMEEALTRILTPKRSVDILRDVHAAREAGRPYQIVFVGVNGVGKSTNLSKVAYWLLQHDIKVMIAACDTFRAGAVEQLRTHCKRLGVPLFERGYEKDPANVASEAVKAAQRQGCDAVLVDTAGRMQDNEPLMRALSKLINMNEPDLVLFVGEALVGNDAVDQLSKFNERLSDLSADANRTRLIDGIVLSKFDTIDDKVGAALSMVYTSGAPVMFVGCGQTYTDLRKLNVKSIVKVLLSQ